MSKKVKIILIAAIVVVVAGVALFFLLKPGKKIVEARLVEMTLPTATDNIMSNVEEVSLVKSGFKKDLLIRGWAFKENTKEKTRELYLVLQSDKSTLVYDLVDDNLNRPGVSEFFKLTGSADNHGYEAYLPLDQIKDPEYKVGFLLKDETGLYFAMSDRKLQLSEGSAKQVNYEIGAHLVNMQMKPETDKIKYFFETLNVNNNVLTISGWGFLKGLNTDSLKSYLVLRKDNKNIYFTMVPQLRTGVTTYFKDEFGVNLDHSGYSATIDGKQLQKGKYEVLLYIVRGKHVGLTYSNQFIELGI